ncbi:MULTISPECIES: hypothetical protein [unclassified Cryobacterium]|uniref:hypothetical protein n=1 Tax=unclassified Cryobacterium TaxID=2649013 RepID=UPI002AB5314C|nr:MULTISPECIES: hypothetical protein [unclassified Cryobacterium]MDY7528382.1 hypothetical protein [Cryobacterium sp. 10C2]MDY7555871.1 hypothetical protein [Cryobacterium sp. 10C3]MEB0202760.1 hypothetical protein [Cryobacterium sp. 5I3]MEB0288255.1 hypothetical protein [Cryobacterium sp. 10S3]MEB0291331.1 hypothetical protein [Cryobacterium sp. 10C2]
MAEQNVPFHVVLDLTEDRAYSVLTLALEGYADRTRAEAENEEQNEQPNQFHVNDLNALAEIAANLLEDIDRQLTQTDKALS